MIKNIEKYVKNVSNTQMDFYLMIFFLNYFKNHFEKYFPNSVYFFILKIENIYF